MGVAGPDVGSRRRQLNSLDRMGELPPPPRSAPSTSNTCRSMLRSEGFTDWEGGGSVGTQRRLVIGSAAAMLVLVTGGGVAIAANSQTDWASSENVCHTATTYSDKYFSNSYVDWTLRGYHMQWYVQKSDPHRLWRVFAIPGDSTRLPDGSARPKPAWWSDLQAMPASVYAIHCGSTDQPEGPAYGA